MDLFDGMFERESLMTALEIMIKLGIGAVLGGLIGWERELHGRPAGVRTHMLMVIGVILIAEVSKSFGGGDPARIAAQIVTGVGFLGAGTIMRMGPEVRGLTTAASIWAAAGIGLAVSSGGPLLLVAVAATALVLITLALVDDLERRISPKGKVNDMVVILKDRAAVGAFLEAIHAAGGSVSDVRFGGEGPNIELAIRARGDRKKLDEAACSLEGVLSCSWSE
jgi:putative Mg2+ transporter-C (MgtC) family protein